ncbi:MAG: hypothetical protein ABEN55_06760 [Bradymonadaceae bacterium]
MVGVWGGSVPAEAVASYLKDERDHDAESLGEREVVDHDRPQMEPEAAYKAVALDGGGEAHVTVYSSDRNGRGGDR